MSPEKLPDVIRWLMRAPLFGDEKEKLLFGWARTVGIKLTFLDRQAVRNSGIDR